jgi:hypothetical protein
LFRIALPILGSSNSTAAERFYLASSAFDGSMRIVLVPRGRTPVGWVSPGTARTERDGTTVSFRRYADPVGVGHLRGTWPNLRQAVALIRDAIDHLRRIEGIDDILAYHPGLRSTRPSRTHFGRSVVEGADD